MSIRAWTDYPILQLGDIGGKLAPIRLVEVISYDRDKYCVIQVSGVIESVKRCYLYKQRGRCGKARKLSDRQLKKLPITVLEDDPKLKKLTTRMMSDEEKAIFRAAFRE